MTEPKQELVLGDKELYSSIERCIEIMGNTVYDGSYAAPREAFRDVLRSTRLSALEEAITYIGDHQGWEESEDIYRKHFGLPTKYTPQ